MADRPVARPATGPGPSDGGAAGLSPTSVPHAGHADYYDPAWGALVEGQRVDEADEPWFRQLPHMRVYGFVVLAVALVTAYPRADPGGWRGPAALAGIVALAAVFWIMWVRRPIWEYPTRILAVHGAFQVAAYAALVSISPSFAVLQLVVYPQVVFSLPMRWSIAGGMSIGVITGLAILAGSSGVETALPLVFYNLLTAALVIAMAVWMRQTIAQSMERRALIEQLQTARLELAAAESEAAVGVERARFAREIHDTLAQGFASVVTHLEAADASLEADPMRARGDVRAAREVARASLAEARTLVWALRPETIATAGLAAAIERIATTAESAGTPVEVTISGRPRTLHPEVEVTLLRAAQECLANARQHAAASRVTVTLTYFADEVSLDVADDGRGFDPSAAGRTGGMGLLGMRERVDGLGGRLAIETATGEGTIVAVTLPAIEPPVPAATPATVGPAVASAGVGQAALGPAAAAPATVEPAAGSDVR